MSTKQFWDPRLDSAFQEVNMRAVRVARRKHGRGTFKFPDDRGYYSGSWLRGLRHGMGVTLDLSGKFMGRFKRERRRGHGTHVYAHGDVVRGKYACPTRRIRASLLQGDEYCDGMLEGPAVIRFTDGSACSVRPPPPAHFAPNAISPQAAMRGMCAAACPTARVCTLTQQGGVPRGTLCRAFCTAPACGRLRT